MPKYDLHVRLYRNKHWCGKVHRVNLDDFTEDTCSKLGNAVFRSVKSLEIWANEASGQVKDATWDEIRVHVEKGYTEDA